MEALAPAFVDGTERFAAIEGNEFNGYYNLLRKDERKVIGLQFYPFEPDVGQLLGRFKYVSSHIAESGDYELTIYFDGEGEEVHNLTILQEWGKNYIYRSEAGTFAASFGIPLESFEIASDYPSDS